MNLHLIRELAAEKSVEEIERMIEEMINSDRNALMADPVRSEQFSALVKAKTVRDLVDSGLTLPEAIRELGSRMRRGIGRRE